MNLSERDQKVCDKYSGRSKGTFTNCENCPLVRDIYAGKCKANSTYNVHTMTWEMDDNPENVIPWHIMKA